MKYKIYDKESKVIKDVACINLKDQEVSYYLEDVLVNKSFDEVDLLKSTNVINKESREIYVGHIIHDSCTYEDYDNNIVRLDEVGYVYDAGYYIGIKLITMKYDSNGNILEEFGEYIIAGDFLRRYDILGNIYELPEAYEEIKDKKAVVCF